MSTTQELEFKDLKELNNLLKNRGKSGRQRKQTAQLSENLGSEMHASQASLQSQSNENRRNQQGGNHPEVYLNVTEPGYNTLYGNLSDPAFYSNNMTGGGDGLADHAKTVSEKLGITDALTDFLGGIQDTVNQTVNRTVGAITNQPRSATKRKQTKQTRQSGEKYTRQEVADAVAGATGDLPENVHETIKTLYGSKRKQLTEDELAQVAEIHSQAAEENPKLTSLTRNNVIDAVARATGDIKENIEKTIGHIYGSQKNFNDQQLTNVKNVHSARSQKGQSQKGGTHQNICFKKQHVIEAVAAATGDHEGNVKKTIEQTYGSKRDFTESELADAVTIHLGQSQTGGHTLPWEWYNAPSLVGGKVSDHDLAVLDITNAIAKNKKLHEALGSEDLVITPTNKLKLFAYLYKLYPELREEGKTSTIFEDADNDDAFIWSEYQDVELPHVINYIFNQTLNYYKNTYSTDVEGHKHLVKLFNIEN